VEALVNAGITSGCGGGKFCLNDPVTRGQMAAFLNRLGALAPDKPPAVNADRLDGRHADELSRADSMSNGGIDNIPLNSSVQEGETLTITAPADGLALVNGSVTFRSSDCTVVCIAHLVVQHVESGQLLGRSEATVTSAIGFTSATVTGMIPVQEGVNNFRLLLTKNINGNGSIGGHYSNANALFTPFGPEGE